MPFSLLSQFSITRFNFFSLQVLLTRASLLALAKSIYCTLCVFHCFYCSIPLSSNQDIRTEPKHIVFLSKLLLLFQFCHFRRTGNKSDVTATQSGTAVTIRTTCTNSGCRKEFTWTSQPLMSGTKLPAGNFLICMATLCWWVLHKGEDHISAYGTGLCVIKYFLQVPRVRTSFPVQNVIQ